MISQANAEPAHFQPEARVRKAIMEVCCEQGENPGFVRLHYDEFDGNTSAVFSVELPPAVHVLAAIEWHPGRLWNLRRKRDPMAIFEIDVGDDKLRKAARIVGAPADHASAVFTQNIRRWLLAYRDDLEFSATASEVHLWVDELPPEEVARMFALELIAIAQQFRAPQGVPTLNAFSGAFRGVQPVTDEGFEQARRQHEIAAYQDACRRQPRDLRNSIVAIAETVVTLSFITLFVFLVVVRMIESC